MPEPRSDYRSTADRAAGILGLMPQLLSVDPARQAIELGHAAIAEAAEADWRRSWRRVYAQCIGLMLLGYACFGASWALTGRSGGLLAAGSLVIAYVLPFFRLLIFFVRHADQF